MTEAGNVEGGKNADASELNESSISEKFAVVPVDPASRIFAFHNTAHGGALQMVEDKVQGKAAAVEDITIHATWEHFRVVQVADARIDANDVPFDDP